MLTKVYGSALLGVDSSTITIEVNVDKGIGYHKRILLFAYLQETYFELIFFQEF